MPKNFIQLLLSSEIELSKVGGIDIFREILNPLRSATVKELRCFPKNIDVANFREIYLQAQKELDKVLGHFCYLLGLKFPLWTVQASPLPPTGTAEFKGPRSLKIQL